MEKQFFLSKEAYLKFKAAWADLAQKKKVTSTDILFYNIIRGKKFRRGFTPITKATKLSNGASPDQAFTGALSSLRYLARTDTKWSLQNRQEFLKRFNETLPVEVLNDLSVYVSGEMATTEQHLLPGDKST
jgi:hypothetical protein